MKKRLLRLKVLFWLICGFKDISQHHNGGWKALFWLYRTTMRIGPRQTLATALSQLAEVRSTNVEHYRRWCSNQKPSHQSGKVTLSGETLGFLLFIVREAESQWEASLESIVKQGNSSAVVCLVAASDVSGNVSSQMAARVSAYENISLHDDPQSALGKVLESCKYLCCLNSGDQLSSDAIAEILTVLDSDSPDLIYTDHDFLEDFSGRSSPYFKPDFSPDLLHDANYIAHTCIWKNSSISATSRAALVEADDIYNFTLATIPQCSTIRKIDAVLFHLSSNRIPDRKHDEQTYREYFSKTYSLDSELSSFCGEADLFLYPQVSDKIRASIIIPTKDRLDLLIPCIDSILIEEHQVDFEIILVNNNSQETETLEWLEAVSREHPNVRVFDCPYPFNWSRLNNDAARLAAGEVLIFLNNDTEASGCQWLARLCSLALRNDVGLVGPLLVYPDGSIQHAGMVVGFGGFADHIYLGASVTARNTGFVSPRSRRNVLALTGACQAISKMNFELLGGYDENFEICGSDVELCIRAHEAGLVNVYDPGVVLTHHESKTRVVQQLEKQDRNMASKAYDLYLSNGDPFYNPNLSLMSRFPLVDIFKSR